MTKLILPTLSDAIIVLSRTVWLLQHLFELLLGAYYITRRFPPLDRFLQIIDGRCFVLAFARWWRRLRGGGNGSGCSSERGDNFIHSSWRYVDGIGRLQACNQSAYYLATVYFLRSPTKKATYGAYFRLRLSAPHLLPQKNVNQRRWHESDIGRHYSLLQLYYMRTVS